MTAWPPDPADVDPRDVLGPDELADYHAARAERARTRQARHKRDEQIAAHRRHERARADEDPWGDALTAAWEKTEKQR